MISVNNAVEIILNNSENFGSERIDFRDSLNRTLKEDIKADRDFPPFDRVSMDGIAIFGESFRKGQRKYQIEDERGDLRRFYQGGLQIDPENNNDSIMTLHYGVFLWDNFKEYFSAFLDE